MSAFRAGFAALAGRPNTGKSTLMNRLIGEKIAITSARPQTTRTQIRTVYTDEEAQIVFVDTPGLHIAKNRLGSYMVTAAKGALKDVDAVLVMTEPGGEMGEVERALFERVKRLRLPCIAVVNKTDLYPREQVESTCGALALLAPDCAVFPVSALKGEGCEALLKALKAFMPYGEALYDADALTDQPMREIAAEIVREKALRLLQEEVPHGIAVQTEKMRERTLKSGETITDVSCAIVCERETHKGIVIGRGGRMLKKIGQLARLDIERLTGMRVNLQLFVKVRKDWRNDETQLKSLGYR